MCTKYLYSIYRSSIHFIVKRRSSLDTTVALKSKRYNDIEMLARQVKPRTQKYGIKGVARLSPSEY